MRRRKLSPSQQRYEAEFPTITARIPAEVKTRLDAMLQAQGLNLSEWAQAMVAGAAPDHEKAVAAGRTAGYRHGLAEGQSHARGTYLILAAATLGHQYGARLGDTNDAWVDIRAAECVRALTVGQRKHLAEVMDRTPEFAPLVARWLRDSGLPPGVP